MSGLIEPVKIGYDRYGEMNINLYDYGEVRDMTLGQLVNAVCCRAGMALETQSIAQVNRMTRHSNKLKALAAVMKDLVAGVATYDTLFTLEGYGTVTARAFLTDEFGCVIGEKTSEDEPKDGNLPASLDAANDRLAVYTALKSKVDSMTTESQQMMIDLQSCVSRRDIVFSTATSIVQTLGGVLQTTATNY